MGSYHLAGCKQSLLKPACFAHHQSEFREYTPIQHPPLIYSLGQTFQPVYELFSYPKWKKRSSLEHEHFNNFNFTFTSSWHQPTIWGNQDAVNIASKHKPGKKVVLNSLYQNFTKKLCLSCLTCPADEISHRKTNLRLHIALVKQDFLPYSIHLFFSVP